MATTKAPVKDREGGGQLNISLHPLVIINISDHWTRFKIQNQKENPRVIGALLGIQHLKFYISNES